MAKRLGMTAANPEDAAKGVLAAANQAGYHGLTAMPWNRFDPTASTWWLVPSTENPAYKFGKIIFTRRGAEPEDMLVGLYFEKGIGPAAAGLYADTARGRRYLMDGNWTWHRLATALAGGNFDAVITEAESACGRPITVVLDAENVSIPTGQGESVHSPDLPRDIVRLVWSSGRLQWLDADLPAGILRKIGKPDRMSKLAESIQAIENLDWVWLNFQVGLRVALGASAPACEIWTDEMVWERAGHPWRQWLY